MKPKQPAFAIWIVDVHLFSENFAKGKRLAQTRVSELPTKFQNE